jgi:UDP-N-acetylglucosamine 2-epimerase (hydrolysing)
VKRILFITGTRADFGKIKQLIIAAQQAPGFEGYIFATGMHLIERYGYTLNEIKKAGLKNIFPFDNINYNSVKECDVDVRLANTIVGLNEFITYKNQRPDLIVVHGDRAEALAGAIVGAFNNILTAHIEGGELSGTVDELVRHSVSKLSHIHFVSNFTARQRLIQMGELPETIHTIGSPEVDIMLSDKLPTFEQVKQKYDIAFNEYGIFIFHPDTEANLFERTSEVINGLKESGRNFIVIYPNNDPGSEQIMWAIDALKDEPNFRVYPSLRHEYYLTLLKNAFVIVGNSSSGIREAPVYGIPSINVGGRQHNRFKSQSILDIPSEKEAVLYTLANLPKKVKPSLNFGKGNSTELFMKKLKSERFWCTPRQKQFRDLT